MKHNYLIFAFIITLSLMFYDAQYIRSQSKEKKFTIAVLDFTPISQISQEEVNLLTEIFRSSLIKNSQFIVVERSKMIEIMKEQDFSTTDNCNTNECAIQVGQLLSAEKMITGNIGKIGNTFSVTIRLIDVSTGKSDNSVDYKHKGSIDDLLDVMKNLADDLVNPISNEKLKTVTFTGALTIKDVNKCYSILTKTRYIKDVKELSVQQESSKYRLVYNGKSISTLRQLLTEEFKNQKYSLTLVKQEDNNLEFAIQKKYTTAPTFPFKLFGVTAAASLGGGVYSYLTAKNSYDKFKKATTTDNAIKYRDKTKKFNNYTVYSAAGLGGSLLCYWLYGKIYKASLPESYSFSIEYFDSKYAMMMIQKSF